EQYEELLSGKELRECEHEAEQGPGRADDGGGVVGHGIENQGAHARENARAYIEPPEFPFSHGIDQGGPEHPQKQHIDEDVQERRIQIVHKKIGGQAPDFQVANGALRIESEPGANEFALGGVIEKKQDHVRDQDDSDGARQGTGRRESVGHIYFSRSAAGSPAIPEAGALRTPWGAPSFSRNLDSTEAGTKSDRAPPTAESSLNSREIWCGYCSLGIR